MSRPKTIKEANLLLLLLPHSKKNGFANVAARRNTRKGSQARPAIMYYSGYTE
jgi:hypothetical protein